MTAWSEPVAGAALPVPAVQNRARPAPAWRARRMATASRAAALVVKARTSDREAFGELYELRFNDVFRFIFASVRETERAEDLTAQTFLTVWRKLGSLRDPEKFDAWLFQIAYRQIVDDVRARKARPQDTAAADPIDLADESALCSPSAVLALRENARDLQAALAQLSDEQRQVLVLRFLRDLSHAEVADAMGKREDAVRALQYRALRRMREILSGPELAPAPL